MILPRRLRSATATVLAAAMFLAAMPVGHVRAEMVGTDRIIEHRNLEARRAEISAFLARQDVRERLAALGVAPDEAQIRVDSLTDAEVLQLAQDIEDLPAGQDQGYTLVVILLLVIILVLLI
ncbi:MAG: PA2779 family protein [Rhodospirillales bacterium]|nr:MAG: PA2779 family protein [Rhodospirillales bacterium]